MHDLFAIRVSCTPDDHESIQVASPMVDKSGSPGWTEFAMRAAALRAQQERSQQLFQYCDETVAAIRASLQRTLNERS